MDGQASANVLVVEDDPDVRVVLQLLLEDEGWSVTSVATGEEALALFDQVDPDVALVDLRLPGMGGFDVVRAVRARSDVPVVIVTAQTASEDVVEGLEAGADDYVTKPFDPAVLLARLRATLRRAAPPSTGTDGPLMVGDLEVRPRTAEVRVGDREVGVTRTELRLLQVLADAGGEVLSREDLLARVWSYDYLGDSRMVDAHVRRLRLKLEDDPSEPRRLLTVRGLGYRLVPARSDA